MSAPLVRRIEAEESDLQKDPRWELAQRIARSPGLARATQLQAILIFLVRQAILYPHEPLQEGDIARRVLGRKNDFNPLEDNIVRVQVARLRKKLKLYFSTEGLGEDPILIIELGSYKPQLIPRPESDPAPMVESDPESAAQQAHAGLPQSPLPELAVLPLAPPQSPLALLPGLKLQVALAVVCLALGGAFGYLAHTFRSSTERSQPITNSVVRRIFAPNTTVNVVVTDAVLATLQTATGSDVSVSDYVSSDYPDNLLSTVPDPSLRSVLQWLTRQQHTAINDADVAAECARLGLALGAHTEVRYPRLLRVSDFQQGNFVLLGSRRGNPWTGLFEQQLNFVAEREPGSNGYYFRNRHPHEGEAARYPLATERDGSVGNYIDVAMVPNLSRTGVVLLLNGFWRQANEEAEDLVLSPTLPPVLSKAFASYTAGSTVEVLVRVHQNQGAQSGWEVVAMRRTP